MKIKPGVRILGMKPEIVLALMVADSVWRKHGATDGIVLTSGIEGKHKRGSIHYKGLAADIRTWNLHESVLDKAVEDLKKALGGDFDVVLESSHVHLEYDPKEPY